MDMRQTMAQGTALAKVADKISEKFGGGLAYPFEALLVPTDSTLPILSEDFFDKSSKFLTAVKEDVEAAVPESKGTAYDFLSYQSGDTGSVPFEPLNAMCQIEEKAAKLNQQVKRRLQDASDFAPLCSFFLDTSTNTADYRKVAPTAAYGVIVTSMEPLSKAGGRFLLALRQSSEKHGPKYGIKASIGGTPAKALDMKDKVYTTLPVAAVATLATAVLFLMISFRSVFIPVRCLLSNLMTLGVSYGVAQLVYEEGVLNFVGYKGLSNHFGAIPWFPPVPCLFIIMGIGLDYDIFVLVRITEFRGKGYDPQRAIQEGLISTAGIITAAGVVMVFAFSGMLAAGSLQGNMFGFMMCSAVIYDTFVARSIVVPAGMSILGYWNWWPSQLAKHEHPSRTLSAMACSELRCDHAILTEDRCGGYVEEDNLVNSLGGSGREQYAPL
jgi:uncharacterized membrane protein YdfJ with MMPL/SSD domain